MEFCYLCESKRKYLNLDTNAHTHTRTKDVNVLVSNKTELIKLKSNELDLLILIQTF